MMMFVSLLCTLLILLGGTIATAQELETSKTNGGQALLSTLTLEQALGEALQNNLGLLAERVNLTIAEASLITAKLRPNPVVSFSADHQDWLGTGFNRRNNGGPPEIAWRIDVPVERGNKRQLRIETATYEKEIAEVRLLDAIRTLKLEVALACIDVIQAKVNLALAGDNLHTFGELVLINEVKVKDGSIAPLELTRSQVAMLQFRGNVKRAELELATAKTKLQYLLGRNAEGGAIDILGELKAPQPSPSLELVALEETAITARPDVRALERTQARSQSELKLQLAQAKVDYTWGVEYRRQEGISGRANTLGLFLSVPVLLYSRNQGEIARVLAEEERVARQMQALQAQVRTEVRTAYQEFSVARQLVESIERDLLQPATQARDTVAYTYRSGAASLIEFLDAQRAFNDTMQSYYEAQASYRRSVIKLDAAVGKEVTG